MWSDTSTSCRSARSLMALVLGATIATAGLTPLPDALPTIAFESAVVYRLELAAATALLSTLLVSLFARGLLLGHLPATIGRDGVGWDSNAADERQ